MNEKGVTEAERQANLVSRASYTLKNSPQLAFYPFSFFVFRSAPRIPTSSMLAGLFIVSIQQNSEVFEERNAKSHQRKVTKSQKRRSEWKRPSTRSELHFPYSISLSIISSSFHSILFLIHSTLFT